MIACAATKLIASQFAIVGSIGVIAQAPNIYKLLDNNGVEVVQRTAGEYKRTIQIFQPNTEEGLKKFDEELALVHSAFISHVSHHRSDFISDPSRVFTGESWLATHAIELGLVDEIMTSDEYIRRRQLQADAFLIRPRSKRQSSLSSFLSRFADDAHDRISFFFSSIVANSPWWPFQYEKIYQDHRGGLTSAPNHQHHEASPQVKAREFGGSALETDAARSSF